MAVWVCGGIRTPKLPHSHTPTLPYIAMRVCDIILKKRNGEERVLIPVYAAVEPE